MADDGDNNRSAWGEAIKFGLLVLAAVLLLQVVATSRETVFGRLIPAVLGEDLTVEPPAAPANTVSDPEPASAEQAETATPTLEPAVTPLPAADTPQPPSSSPQPLTHTVQSGENLTTIASQYGVTVQAIVSANNLANPHQILVGTVLVIPAADE